MLYATQLFTEEQGAIRDTIYERIYERVQRALLEKALDLGLPPAEADEMIKSVADSIFEREVES